MKLYVLGLDPSNGVQRPLYVPNHCYVRHYLINTLVHPPPFIYAPEYISVNTTASMFWYEWTEEDAYKVYMDSLFHTGPKWLGAQDYFRRSGYCTAITYNLAERIQRRIRRIAWAHLKTTSTTV